MILKYQNICLFLSDGRKIIASVPAFMDPGDHVTIRDVKVTEAQELPEGHSWATLSKGE